MNMSSTNTSHNILLASCHVPLPEYSHVIDQSILGSSSHMTSSPNNVPNASSKGTLPSSCSQVSNAPSHVPSSSNHVSNASSHVTSSFDHVFDTMPSSHAASSYSQVMSSSSHVTSSSRNALPELLDARMLTDHSAYQTQTTSHIISHGSEHIPPHPLDHSERRIVGTIAALQILSGFLTLILSALIHKSLKQNNVYTHPPALWWSALLPLVIGICGCLAARSGNRKRVFIWGLSSLLVLVTQTAVMGVVGNFSLALYGVWPLHSHHRGHPLCQEMVEHCYCQDYYHGAYSRIVMPGVQYIHEDVVWKETGFISCDDTRYTSILYFSMMSSLAVFTVVSLFGCGLAFSFSVCAKSTLKQFQQLDQENDDEEDDEGIEQDLTMDSTRTS